MKYKSVNDLKTIALKDARLTLAVMSSDQLRLNVEGPVIRGDNPNNNRYEDMYCVLMELLFDQVDVKEFVLQGYKYYDANGKLLETVPDRPLTPQEQRDSLLFNDNAWVFSLDQNEDGIWRLVYDLEEEGTVNTYEIRFTFKDCIASWDRFSGPVEG